MKLNLGCGDKPLDGFVNLDKKTGWFWESGLPYDDETVDAITVSHSLMYVDERHMLGIYSEFYRVLKDHGVIRITEDSTDDPASERFGGHPEAVYHASAGKCAAEFVKAGFKQIYVLQADKTRWFDKSLMQNYHGGRPKCFFIEAIK